MFFALRTETPWFILINSICVVLILYRVMALLDSEFKRTSFKLRIQPLLQLSFGIFLMFGLLYLGVWGMIALVALVGILLLTGFTQLTENSNFGSGLANGWTLATASTRQLLEFQGMILILSFSFLMVLSAPLILMYTSFLQWNFALTDTWGQYAIKFIEIFIKIFSFNLIIPIFAAGTGYLYFTLQEISTAAHLKQAIARVGTRSQKNQKR
jgi:hypothetical protein